MTLLAYDRLKDMPSKKLCAAIGRYAQVEEDDYGIRWDIGDEGQAFLRSYEILRAHGNGLLHSKIPVIEDPKVYPQDREHITGFVLSCKDLVFLRNPAEDYKRPPDDRCVTLLKENAEIDLEERPKGLFVEAGDDFIIHDDLLMYLASDAIGGVKPVRYRGKVLTGWNRIHINERNEVIDDIVFDQRPCAMCGRPHVTTMNEMWFAKTDRPIEKTACNKKGVSHYGEEPCIVISKEVMAQLRTKKLTGPRSGLRLFPLYTKNTKRYEVIRRIQDAMAK